MSEGNKETKVDASAEDKGGQKQEPDKSKSASGGGKADDDDDDDDEFKGLTPAQIIEKVKQARSESKKRREGEKSAKEEAKAAREEAAALKKAKDDEELEKKKKAGEWEAIAKEKDEKLTAANQRIIRSELRLIAQAEGIVDASDVNTIPLDGLTIDDKGEVHGAEKAVKKLKAEKPHYFKAAEDPASKKKEEEKPKPTSGVTEPPKGKTSKAEDDEEISIEQKNRNFLAAVKARK